MIVRRQDQVPDKVTRDALKWLSDWLDNDVAQGSADRHGSEPVRDPLLLYFAAVRDMKEAGSVSRTGL